MTYRKTRRSKETLARMRAGKDAARMAQRVHILDLCKAFGWAGTKQALTYFNPKASDIAKRAS